MAHDEAPMGIFNANTLKAAWISPLDGSGTLSYGAAANSYSDGADMVFGTVTGTEIGTAASQKLGFYGATPIVQGGAAATTAGFTAGSGTGVNDDSSFTGNEGDAAYTIGDIVRKLKLLGLIASS